MMNMTIRGLNISAVFCADVSARIYHDYCYVQGAEARLYVKPIHMVKSALTFALMLRNNFLDF